MTAHGIFNNITKELCFIYNPNKVLNAYNYSSGSQQKIYRRKKKIADTVKAIENDNIELEVRGFFDVKTHYFYEETRVYRYEHYRGRIRRKYYADILHYFETFDQFIEYRKGNLKNCDISGAITLDIDFSKFDVDKETTKLPICLQMDLKYIVKKIYYKDFFWVGQFWNNKEGYVVKKYTHKFEYFFDFVSFLKGDLSYVDLITCDGLNNLNDISGINFLNAKLVSSFCEKFDIPFTKYNINNNLIESFKIVQNNEEQTALYLNEYRDEDIDDLFCDTEDVQRVQYISDLHLMHKIKNANCKSMEDITCLIQHIINNIIDESGNLVLIGGDVASEFSLFELFIKILRKELDSYRIRKVIVFVLGNHEFWGFSNHSIDQIVAKYRCLLEENNMYLLHNDLFFKKESDEFGIIPYNELLKNSNEVIGEKLKCARIVILGGVGFSGYNPQFNAENGIYRGTIDRNTEVVESKKFEAIYNKLCNILERKNTIIFTHMPKKDWCLSGKLHSNYVYVSGHTHNNFFSDDGEYRVYSDNQIGYKNEQFHLKSFLMNNDYDYFSEYSDGIYEITAQEYNDFYRGKNILMNFNREVNVLYMLKKQGYYCFIHKSINGKFAIMNGGAIKNLNIRDIQYYYDNMDAVISLIKKPLNKYTKIQECIAKEIMKIGGCGYIHGCIIDIDFFNHVYVNPIDLKVTGYWASDIINKIIYPDIPSLLKDKC